MAPKPPCRASEAPQSLPEPLLNPWQRGAAASLHCHFSSPFFLVLFLQECLDKFGDSLQEMINYHMVRGCFLLSPWVLVALLMSPVVAIWGPGRVRNPLHKGRGGFTKVLHSRIFSSSFWAAVVRTHRSLRRILGFGADLGSILEPGFQISGIRPRVRVWRGQTGSPAPLRGCSVPKDFNTQDLLILHRDQSSEIPTQ